MIGIVTPYKVVNYGTKLQAYAMQQLMSKYDDAELLGFIPRTDSRITSIIGKAYLKTQKKRSTQKATPVDEEIKKRKKIIDAFDKYYRFGETIKGNSALKKKIVEYNAIVCGSDQLWAPSNVIADYFTLTIIPESINKFSYAASFGIDNVPEILRKRYKGFIESLNTISVREQQGKAIVKEITGKEATVVLDPTLMLETSEWEALTKESNININDQYVFCYFLGTSLEHRKFAYELAKKEGLVLVTIPHFKGWNEADETFGDVPVYEAGPVEFLNLIKCAKYVCTDSFHGTVFSVLFERQVAVFERYKNGTNESTNSRIYTLLASLGLDNQLYTGDVKCVKKFIDTPIDYIEVNKTLKMLKDESFEFLDKALGKKRK